MVSNRVVIRQWVGLRGKQRRERGGECQRDDAKREGMSGISTRFVMKALDNALSDNTSGACINPINVRDHCYGCTAGQGSSCGGALG